MSPFADGPIKFNGTLSDGLNIENITKYGKSFSIVRVPYAFKLLIQELQTMNIQLRVITEDNVDQMTSMSFSNNIDKLLGANAIGPNVTIKELNAMNFQNMNTSMRGAQQDKETGVKPAQITEFNKLTQPLFLRWLIPKTTADTIEAFVPIAQLDGKSNVPEADAEAPWRELTDKLNAAKNKLNPIPKDMYTKINQTLDLYRNLRNTISRKYNMLDATNASLKMYELIMKMNLVDCANLVDNTLNSFSNAELPGAFIIAINYYIQSKCSGKKFNWLASSYLPAAAVAAGDVTILEDKFKLYANNRDRWLMGPRPNALPEGMDDITGDVTDPDTVISLGIGVKQRFTNTSGSMLYTSDAGIDVTEDYAGQEENTSSINYGQIISGLLTLAPGGNFVTKQYTFFTPFSRSLIAIVSAFFEETYITKPATSRPGNSEVYLVGKGFKGMDKTITEALIERSNLFHTLGTNPTELGSLVTPEVLASVDQILYKISEEFFMNIQIKFINEYVEVFKQYSGHMDVLADSIEKLVKQSEMNWLTENEAVPIRAEQSLTWYRHQGTGTQGQKGQKGKKKQMTGGSINLTDNNSNDDNNFPTSLETGANSTPVGLIASNIPGRDYDIAEEEDVDIDLDETGAASEFEGANPLIGENFIRDGPMTGGGESSLLEFKEDKLENEEKSKEESSGGEKKVINVTL